MFDMAEGWPMYDTNKIYDLDERLTPNFALREVVEWPKHQTNMTAADRIKAIEMATAALNSSTYSAAKKMAEFLQNVRAAVNRQFPAYLGRIGIRVMSWLRPKPWELYRKRSGTSQHITGHGVDIVVTGVTAFDYGVIMQWIWETYQNHDGGLARLFRDNRWGFIHFDFGRRRRWEY